MSKKFRAWIRRGVAISAMLCLLLCGAWSVAIAANAADGNILYSSSFDTDCDGLPDGWSFLANSFSKTAASVTGGKLEINGTRSTSKATSAALPVESASDVAVEFDMRIAESKNAECWAAVLLRISSESSLRVKFKSDARNSGVVIEVLRANGIVWETVKSASFDGFSPDKEYRVRVAALGQKLVVTVDGTLITLAEGIRSSVKAGQIAFAAQGCKLRADNVKVETVTGGAEFEDVSGFNAPVYKESSVSVTPVLATPVYGLEQLRELREGQLIEVAVGQKHTVSDEKGEAFGTVGEVIAAMNGRYVPIYVPKDKAAASDLAEYLKARNITDAFVKSADKDIIRLLRRECPEIGGILDATARTVSDEGDLLSLCGEANAAGAKVIVLPFKEATKEAVAYLQKRLMTVWCEGSGEEILLSVLHGVNGVITEDTKGFTDALDWLSSDKNAMVRSPLVIGHRGLPSTYLENSISGAVAAAEAGVDAIELDIYLTTDKRLVILHDGTLDRTTTGKGTAENMSLAQIREFKLNNGEDIPILEDFFEALKGYDNMFFIEIKSTKAEAIDVLKNVIEQYNMQSRAVMISFYSAQLKVCREKLPENSVGLLLNLEEGDADELLEKYLAIARPLNATLNPSYEKISEAFIRGAAVRGVTVWPWTYKQENAFKSHFSAGYYGLTTDYGNWASAYGIRLDAEDLEIGQTADSARKLTGTMATKANKQVSVSCNYRVLSGEDPFKKTEDGAFYGEIGTSARVILTYNFSTEGLTYTLYSDPVTVTVKDLPPIQPDKPVTPPSSSEEENSSPSESSVNSSSEKESGSSSERSDSENSGCGSTSFGFAAGTVLLAAVAWKKRRS